ncbi:MAG: hypothetical protein ACI9LM_005499 [Alteromonadaceae bacterium]|jgi:hypothetical protein
MLSKHLFHFAMVHETFSATGDIIQGLLPIFIPALKGKSGKIFSAQEFCNDINIMYGIKMHPYVAEEMIPKFVKAQILDEVNSVKVGKQYIISKVTDFDDEKSKDSFIEIYNGFSAISSRILAKVNADISNIDYDYEFSRRLARVSYSESIGISLDERSDISDININSCLDYTFNRFVWKLINDGGENKKILESAYSGAILAEVVLSLQEPDIKKENIKGKTFYIDAPILLNLLGFNDKYSIDCSCEIVKQIQIYGGVLTTSDTYIEEAQNSIRQAVRNYDAKGERSSSINRFMIKNPNKIAEVRYAQTKVGSLLKLKGFNLESQVTNLTPKIVSQRAKALEEKIIGVLNWYKSEEASFHDAEAITFVVSDHGYSSISNMATSKSFYVTNNEKQVFEVNKYLYNNGIFKKPEFSPIISERNLAVLLWVVAGGKGIDVSSLSLISNCSRAMDMNKDAFRLFSQFINDMSPDKSSIYEDIILNDRAMYCLMDEVGGDFSRISKDNAISIGESAIEQLLKDIKSEEESKRVVIENEMKNLQFDVELMKSKQLKSLAVIAEKSRVEIELRSTVRNSEELAKDKRFEALEAKFNENERVFQENVILETQRIERNNKAIESFARKISIVFEHSMVLLISLMICFSLFYFQDALVSGVFDNKYITIKSELTRFLPYALMFVTFWKVPEFIFNRLIKFFSNKIFNYFYKAGIPISN